MGEAATIFEVGPRDGLQNEARLIPAEDKIRLVDLLSATGLRKIEVTSFVNPKAVPQMADAVEVMGGIARSDQVSYTVLTPNLRGYSGAVAAHADEIAVFASASEGFSQANINCSVAESFERFKPVLEAAARDGVPVRGYVSCVVECPYDGPTDAADVTRVAEALFEMGVYEVSLGDTIGRGNPDAVASMLDAVLEVVPATHLAGHFHDTSGRALENIAVALEKGVRVFDASAGGLGGCPFAPGAAGNVATEAVVAAVEDAGFRTGIDRDALQRAAAFAQELRSEHV